MNKPTSPAVTALTLAVLSLTGGAARADVPPSCAGLDSLITCAADDVGKPCQGGGKCYEISCWDNSPGDPLGKIYKCDACPTVVASSEECTIPNFGKACGNADGGTGTCQSRHNHCVTDGIKYVCQTPAAAKPTGPPSSGAAGTSGGAGTSGAAGTSGGAGATGSAGSSGGAGTSGGASSGGCDVAPKPGKPTLIGLGLVMAGLLFFAIDRARRRNR